MAAGTSAGASGTTIRPAEVSSAGTAASTEALTIAADIHPVNNLRIVNALRGEFGASDEQVAEWTRRWIAAGFAALEQDAPENGGFGGASPNLADVCLVPQMYNARRFDLDLSPFPRLVAIDAAMRALDPVARAAPEAVRPA